MAIVGLLMFCTACEEQTSWNLQHDGPVIVVDAILTSEFKPQEISIYQSSGALNEQPEPINDAEVKVEDGTNTYSFVTGGTNGKYYSTEPFAVSINRTFKLIIEYQGLHDTAMAVMEPISPLKNDTIASENGLYKFVYRGSDTPAMLEVYYDWSANPEYCATYGNCYAQSTWYTLSSLDIVKEFAPDKEEILFPAGTQIVRKKYSLSAGHQEFIRELLIETDWRGGLFDVEQGNVPTNFNHGLKGWFATCMLISDTLVVE